MKHLILGTAGHIDHGKTSLVKALTGVDTDRLKEEKARGITIELGFAHLDLDGYRLGIVDVPGHERFIRTMVAGVGGMDLVLLVIAADEGIMPQTREHLEICRLLGVKHGLVALTKADLVDPEWLGLVTEEVKQFIAGSFLADAPVLPVSSRTGEGLPALKSELERLAAAVEPKRPEGFFRLPVDRVFTVTGFGTVVTGTLLSGEIRTGDAVELLPSGIRCKVRGIETHGSRGDIGVAGQRVAVNLQGVEHERLARGDVLVPEGIYRTTRSVDVALHHLPSEEKPLRNRTILRLHSATYEVPAQVILLDRDRLSPGDSAYCRIRPATPVLLLPGDPFILRSSSANTTLGGGRVLDPSPPGRRRRAPEALELLRALEGDEESEKIRLLVASSLLSGLGVEEIARRTGISPRRLEALLSQLLSSGEIVQAVREPRIFVSRAAFGSLKEKIQAELQGYLNENPLKDGIGKEELKSRLPRRSDPRFFGPLLSALEKEGKAVVERELVKLPGRKGAASAGESGLQTGIAEALRRGGAEPPTIREYCDRFRCTEKAALEHLNFLSRTGTAVKVKSDLFYHAESLAAIREKLVSFLQAKGEISPQEFRDLTGLSRKYMIPLLEFFDGERLTIRVGEKRVLRRGR
jgi:selenocysteine-specific elongation factor